MFCRLLLFRWIIRRVGVIFFLPYITIILLKNRNRGSLFNSSVFCFLNIIPTKIIFILLSLLREMSVILLPIWSHIRVSLLISSIPKIILLLWLLALILKVFVLVVTTLIWVFTSLILFIFLTIIHELSFCSIIMVEMLETHVVNP